MLVQFGIWLSSEFFSYNYFQIGQHVVLLHIQVERGSTFTLTCELSYIASILFANVNFTHIRT